MSESGAVDQSSRAATRRSLHGVAELLLAGPQYRLSDSIELAVRAGGFGTVAPPDARVAGLELVVADRRTALDGRSYQEVADDVGLEPRALDDVYGDGPGLTPADLITLDPDATAEIAAAFADGDQALRELAPGERPILWPEHFDIGVEVERVNFGLSPGDAEIDQPYAYVGPWDRDRHTGEFWNAGFGAYRTVDTLGGAAEILAFFREGQTRSRTTAD